LHWRSRSRHLSYGAWQKLRIAAIERPDVREVDPGSMMLSNRLALAVTRSAGSIRLHGRMADVPLEARARRPRPLVDLGWALPVVSIFVTATFKGGTNSLPPEIQVGRVVAGVGDAAIEMLLPFGRSGRQLIGSGGAAVVGVDANGGPPYGDFADNGNVRTTARRSPRRWRAGPVGVFSNLIGEVGDQRGALGEILAPNVMIMKR
jgi:hypothetical protein